MKFVVILTVVIALGIGSASAIAQRQTFSYTEKPFAYSMRLREVQGKGQSRCFEWRRDAFNGSRRTKGSEVVYPRFQRLKKFSMSADIYWDKKIFGEDRYGVIIMQLHGTRDVGLGERFRNPIWAIVYINGNIYLRFKSSRDQVTPYKSGRFVFTSDHQLFIGKPIFNRWNHINVSGKEGFHNNGYISVQMNDIVHTRRNINLGYNDSRGPYLKYGLYYYTGKSDHSLRGVCFANVHVRID